MKIYFYKLLLGIVLTGVFSFSLGFTLLRVGMVFDMPFLYYAPLDVQIAKAILTIILAFYIADKIIDFRILGIDYKLNFIFFVAFATIGIFIVSILSFFMIFGIFVWQKSNAAFSAMCLFLGIIWTARLFRNSEYELGKFLQNCSIKKYSKIDKALLIVLLIIAFFVIIPILCLDI